MDNKHIKEILDWMEAEIQYRTDSFRILMQHRINYLRNMNCENCDTYCTTQCHYDINFCSNWQPKEDQDG